jgi:aspartate kinase
MAEEILSKYGGSSLMRQEDIARIRQITEDDPRRRYLVVSAPGGTCKEDKVTSRLIALAGLRSGRSSDQDSQAEEQIEAIASRFENLYPGSKSPVRERVINVFSDSSLPEEWYAASLRHLGERLQAQLLAESLGYHFVDALEFLLLSERPDNASVLPETYSKIAELATKHPLSAPWVIPGYYGLTASGKVATLGRDGTNITASVLARGMKVETYENFSDSPVLAADPRIVPDPKIIREMTYKEMRDLSYSGFTIFHKDAILPLMGTGIPIHLRSIAAYPEQGTSVVEDRISRREQPICGIAYKPEFCAFTIESDGLNDQEGILRQILSIFDKYSLPIEIPTSGIDDVSLIVDQKKVNGRVSRIKHDLRELINGSGQVQFIENLGCLVVAGKGLRRHSEVSPEIESVLHNGRIEIVADSKGAEKRSFIYVVKMEQGHEAVNLLYDHFFRRKR